MSFLLLRWAMAKGRTRSASGSETSLHPCRITSPQPDGGVLRLSAMPARARTGPKGSMDRFVGPCGPPPTYRLPFGTTRGNETAALLARSPEKPSPPRRFDFGRSRAQISAPADNWHCPIGADSPRSWREPSCLDGIGAVARRTRSGGLPRMRSRVNEVGALFA